MCCEVQNMGVLSKSMIEEQNKELATRTAGDDNSRSEGPPGDLNPL